METETFTSHLNSVGGTVEITKENIIQLAGGNGIEDTKKLPAENHLPWLKEMIAGFALSSGKKNFLVFCNNKYVNILTENIALFYVKDDALLMICFDQQEYLMNYSMEKLENLLTEKQFYRINRQYLINFNAIKEVEHYFARKLLVNPVVPVKEKLLIAREKVTEFLRWLDDR